MQSEDIPNLKVKGHVLIFLSIFSESRLASNLYKFASHQHTAFSVKND